MSVLETLQAEEEKARQKKAAVLEENAKAQESARADAALILEAARRQAEEILEEAQKRMEQETGEMLSAAAGRDALEAEKARMNLPKAAARIVERMERP